MSLLNLQFITFSSSPSSQIPALSSLNSPHAFIFSAAKQQLLSFPSPSVSLFRPRPRVRVRGRVRVSLDCDQERAQDAIFKESEVDLGQESEVFKKTLRLVECSMFASVAGLAYLLSNSLAIEVSKFCKISIFFFFLHLLLPLIP